MPTRRLVLDTNVVLDLYYWQDPVVAPLRDALLRGQARALTDTRCLEELRRVLRLDRFALAPQAQQALLTQYRLACEWHETPAVPVQSIPRCKDPDDQKFLELACSAAADLLLSKDKALLALARRRRALGELRIVTPHAAAPLLAARAEASA